MEVINTNPSRENGERSSKPTPRAAEYRMVLGRVWLTETPGRLQTVLEFLWQNRPDSAADTKDADAFRRLAMTLFGQLLQLDPEGPDLEVSWTAASFQIINKGAPLFKEGFTAEDVSRFSFVGMGRSGQRIQLQRKLDAAGTQSATAAAAEVPLREKRASEGREVVFKEISAGAELPLTELFYRVYGYSYINETVYEPRKIRELWDSGKLVSFAAIDSSNQMIGHVGLMKSNENPTVYEACWGIVDPKTKSRGVFKKLLAMTMDRVQQTPMQYCFFDFVTNHHISQRELSHYGVKDMALLIGCQSRATQASLEKLGLGKDSRDMARYTLLYSILPRVANPFGHVVRLPSQLGEMFEEILRPIGLKWEPTSRFDFLAEEGRETENRWQEQNAVVYKVERSGLRSIERILNQWSDLMREGYQYCGIDLRLSEPGLGQAYDILASSGFCVGGFLPTIYDGKVELCFRMQAIGPTKVAFDDIMLFSESSKSLLKIIRSDHERNSII